MPQARNSNLFRLFRGAALAISSGFAYEKSKASLALLIYGTLCRKQETAIFSGCFVERLWPYRQDSLMRRAKLLLLFSFTAPYASSGIESGTDFF